MSEQDNDEENLWLIIAYWQHMLSSVAQSCPTLRPHGLQHSRPPCLTPTLRVYSNSCPLSRWCHPTISFSAMPFSSRLQSFPASGVFSNESPCIRWPKYWSFSLSISPSNEYSGLISFRMDPLGSPCCPRDSQESSSTPQFKSINYLALSFLHSPTLISIYDYWKNHSLTRWTFVDKVMSLFYNILSRLVIAFLPRSKCLLISWLQSLSTVILEPKKIKSVTIFIVSTSICHEVLG